MLALGLGLGIERVRFRVEDGGGGPVAEVVLQSDDGNWYAVRAVELGTDLATIEVDQTPTVPGTTPYLVLVNESDFLKYKLQPYTAGGFTNVQVDQSATGEAETPTTFSTSGADYELDLFTEGGQVTWQLTAV